MIVSESLIKSWFTLQAQLISGLQLAYVDLHGAGVLPGGLNLTYPDELESTVELSLAAQLAQRSAAPVTSVCTAEDNTTILRIACPMRLGQHASGALVVEVKAPPDRQAIILELLRWGESWLNLVIEQGNEKPDSKAYVRLIQTGMAQQNHQDTLTVVLALLRVRAACSRVALGSLKKDRVILEAVSDLGEFDSRIERVKQTERAMAETVSMGRTMSCSDATVDSQQFPQLHRLLNLGALSGVCCVPLLQGMQTPLVLCFEYANGFNHAANRQSICEEGATIIAPLLELNRERKFSWVHRFISLCREGFAQLIDINAGRKKIFISSVFLFFVLFAISSGAYRVPASATLQGAVQRAVVAPFDGYILDADIRAGQEVAQGELLARLDDRELVGERRRLLGERAELAEQHRQAVVTLDHGQAKILEAQLQQAEAKLALLQDKLSRTELRAPLSGLVISGDLSRSLGVPVQRGELLYQIAPLDEYQVVMEVSDRDIAELKLKQQGTLTLSALPREAVHFTVTGISRMAPEVVSEPTFRVEAALEKTINTLRPGMQGIAKIEVGEHSRWWIWTHDLTDWIRLRLWRLWP